MERIADRYVLEERLGVGGAATVWRALDTALGVARAVKIVDVPDGPARDALHKRLQTEARAMASLAHPGVVAIHDVGVDGEREFIVMDLIEGPSLAQRIEQGTVPVEVVIRIAVQVLDALGAAHAAGSVHRDVKPANILLSRRGDALLCDFGVARHGMVDDQGTQTGAALGSLPYMAPEQRRDARTAGPEADLYGLGCAIYQALTGSNPVDLYLAPGRSPRWFSVPSPLVPVLRRATAARPSDRYPDAASMSRALVLAFEPPQGPVASMEPEPVEVQQVFRVPSAVWLGGVLIFALVAASMVVAPYLERKAEERERAAGVVVNPPIVVTHVLEGRWIGTFAGEAGASLVLEGPDSALMGDLWTPLGGGNQRHSRIEGVFDSQARRVVFRDVSLQPGAGAYVAMLDDDGVLQGQFRGAGADPIGFAFVPSPE